MTTYQWKWLQRPDACMCQTCIELRRQQDQARMIRVLMNWSVAK